MKHDRRELFGLGALAGLVGLSAAKAHQSAAVDPVHVWFRPERQPWTRICTRCLQSVSDHEIRVFSRHDGVWLYSPDQELSFKRPLPRSVGQSNSTPWWEDTCPGEPT